MAAVFNTQVSLAWILVHLYSQPELLKIARDELGSCPNLVEYSHLVRLPFVNSCIDESVRLHTMLPGNTVVRRAKADVTYTDGERRQVSIPAGSMVWLYPNAVHLDEAFFPEPKAFCPMRMLNGNLERMSSEFELVTFGHGRQRCIGEKMARAMICVFLGTILPDIDATPPPSLPQEGFFDLIPASQLRLMNPMRRVASVRQ
ncbi:cytochrome p450 [Chrysochromulina tobinii]|uniref:Cytochrome p450 n=1 Tax=Chrysochromulina tobinii TaxID=1460289 RepID=A0A0M0JL15_9EUKA|nr:cytochrome p450 [Chrysochromulina tobinii]|eukprot:KOO26997.1 cytochrome p450 [Chrysochromulina sp. CCMP291]